MNVNNPHKAGKTTSRSLCIPSGPWGDIKATVDYPAESTDLSRHPWALVAPCFTCGRVSVGVTRISKALANNGICSVRLDFSDLVLSHNVQELVYAAEWLKENTGILGESPDPTHNGTSHNGTTHNHVQLMVGHSLGGVAAIRASSRIPSVQAVATIGTPWHPRSAAATLEEVIPRLAQETAKQHHTGQDSARQDSAEHTGQPSSLCPTDEPAVDITLAGRKVKITRTMLQDWAHADPHADLDALRYAEVSLMLIHSPFDQTVAFQNALTILQASPQPASLLALPEVDHLLTQPGSGARVGNLIAQWAWPYFEP